MARDPITELRRYARHLVEDTDPDQARRVVASAMGRVSPVHRPAWVHRAATAAAALVLFAGSNVGLAVASSGSIPGDSLYPVERFYERVQAQLGIRDDFSGERLREAQVLAERGQLVLALQVAREGLEGRPDLTSPELHTALTRATEALTRAEQEAEALEDAPGYLLTEDVRSAAGSFLQFARTATAGPQAQDVEDPSTLAEQLAERARNLANAAEQAGTAGADREGPPVEVPAGGNGPPSSIPTGPPSGTPVP